MRIKDIKISLIYTNYKVIYKWRIKHKRKLKFYLCAQELYQKYISRYLWSKDWYRKNKEGFRYIQRIKKDNKNSMKRLLANIHKRIFHFRALLILFYWDICQLFHSHQEDWKTILSLKKIKEKWKIVYLQYKVMEIVFLI